MKRQYKTPSAKRVKISSGFTCQWHGCDYATHDVVEGYHHVHIQHVKGQRICRWRKCQRDGKAFCGKSFARSEQLKVHIRSHTNERPYFCTWQDCAHASKTSGHLKIHLRRHTKERPYKCTWCGKSFTRLGRLKGHTRIHTKHRPYKCVWKGCGRTFVESGHLKTHHYTHTKCRPFKCTWKQCGYACTTSGALSRHYRRHTGIRPYKCVWEGCGKTFVESGSLKRHRRTHTKERRYKCSWEKCNQAFTRLDQLKNHHRAHTCWAWQSKGEERIYKLLEYLFGSSNRVWYHDRRQFDKLRNPQTNHILRFDFSIQTDDARWLLIEFDGIQHFQQVYWDEDGDYERRVERDKIKNKWAKQKGYPLLRLHYTKLKHVEQCVLAFLHKHNIQCCKTLPKDYKKITKTPTRHSNQTTLDSFLIPVRSS